MPRRKDDSPHVRANVRATMHSDPVIYEELMNTPAFYRSRRLLSLAELGLQVERGQLGLATVMHAIQSLAGGQSPAHVIRPETLPLPAPAPKAPTSSSNFDKSNNKEEAVHYPGAGNTNVNFESVFGPME